MHTLEALQARADAAEDAALAVWESGPRWQAAIAQEAAEAAAECAAIARALAAPGDEESDCR